MNRQRLLTSCNISVLICALATGMPALAQKGGQGAANGQPFQVLQGQIDATNAVLDQLVENSLSLDDLVADIAALEIQVDAINDQLDLLNADTEANKDAIMGLLEDLADLDGELLSKQDVLDGGCSDGSTLKAIFADGSFICEAAGSSGSSAGLLSLVSVSSWMILPRGAMPRMTELSCPDTFQVSGGGYEAYNIDMNTKFEVLNNMPLDEKTWQLFAGNRESPRGTERLRIRMVCVH